MESLKNDWYYQVVADFDDCESSEELFDKLHEMEADSTVSYPLNCDTGARDGLFEDDEMYMVYNKDDVYKMVMLLAQTLIQ